MKNIERLFQKVEFVVFPSLLTVFSKIIFPLELCPLFWKSLAHEKRNIIQIFAFLKLLFYLMSQDII